jgi:hypothetical protein
MVRGLVSQIDPKKIKGKQIFYKLLAFGDKSDFLPILHKMQNITIIYERNACQVRESFI